MTITEEDSKQFLWLRKLGVLYGSAENVVRTRMEGLLELTEPVPKYGGRPRVVADQLDILTCNAANLFWLYERIDGALPAVGDERRLIATLMRESHGRCDPSQALLVINEFRTGTVFS